MSFRDRLDVEKLLESLGIAYRRSGHKLKALCPNPDHQDSQPSWNIVDRPGSSEHGGHHCFAAETRVLTWDGYREIRDLAGTTARVLTMGADGYARWVDAPFRSFGVQPLWRIVVRRNGVRKTIRATAGHRWFVKVADGKNPVRWVERTTSELRPRHQLQGVRFPRSGRISVSPWGVAHGFTFGDGTLVRQGARGARATLWGDKDACLRSFFPLSPQRDGAVAGLPYVVIGGLPRFFKELPSLDEAPAYLYGWLAGYFAADGCVDESGLPSLASAVKQHLEFVQRVCIRLGVFTHGIKEQRRIGLGAAPSSIFSLVFSRSSLSEDFFLIAKHKERWLRSRSRDVVERRGWVVESVQPTAACEEVYCAVVAGSHNFALEGNLLTGNCFSCKFGGGPWELVMAVRGVDEEEAAEFVGALVRGVVRVPEGVPNVVISMPSAKREYALPFGTQIPSLDGSEWPSPFADYLEGRGITAEQIERWRIGFATHGPLRWRVVIPVHTRGRLVAYVARSIFKDGSARYDMPKKVSGASPTMAILGEPLLDPALNVLFIAEGSFSMFALERAGAPNSTALLGSDWSTEKSAILTAVPWQHVVIATDPDMAGDRCADAISASFRKAKITRLRMGQSPDDCELDVLRSKIEEVLR